MVVTLFRCRKWRHFFAIRRLHRRIDPMVREVAPGFIGVQLFPDWRTRTLRSVSLWSDGMDVYKMGSVPLHIEVAHRIGEWGVSSSCGVYEYRGDWREVMFGATFTTNSPLSQTGG